MSSKYRQAFYVFLGVLNTALMGLSQQGLLPAQYVQYVPYASFLLAALLKEFSAKDALPPAPGMK